MVSSVKGTEGSSSQLIQQRLASAFSPSTEPFGSPQPMKRHRMEEFVTRTPVATKSVIDEQVARYLYATNTSFKAVEHAEFKKLVSLLRPGYEPPSRFDIAGRLLSNAHDQLQENCKEKLQGQDVSMCLDGWSNVRNEPIVCVCITTTDGTTYPTMTVNTSGMPHTAAYLKSLAKEAIVQCETQFLCKVRSFVTDNAANMAKMREELKMDDELDIITYGCAAHLLNLLAHDVVDGDDACKDKVLRIIKYFRNHHLPAAKYKEAGGSALLLPSEVRWNTMNDSLESYSKNWHILCGVCENHPEVVDNTIASLVQNFSLKRKAEDMSRRLKPIAVALDQMQSNTCGIADAVDIWKQLEKTFVESGDNHALKELRERKKTALTPAHHLAYLLHPKYSAGDAITQGEEE
jgi:uncharacterized protein YuzB (UPF0349 family)